MTGDILIFELSALPILLILIVSTISRGLTRGRENALLFWVLLMAFFSSLADVIANLGNAVIPLSDNRVLLTKAFNYVYFGTRNLLNFIYALYIIAVCRTWHRIRQIWKKLLLALPYLALVVMLFLNPVNGRVFTVTSETGYMRGEGIYLIYLIAVFYFLVGMVWLFIHWNLLTLSEWISLFSLYILNAVGVAIQYFFPRLFVECYFTSVTLIFVVLFVQKPEKQIDMNTGLPGFYAFKQSLMRVEKSRQEVQVIITCIKNADEISRFLGDEAYLEFVHRLERAMAAFGRREKMIYEQFFEPPGMFYNIVFDMDYKAVEGIQSIRELVRKNNYAVADSGIPVDLKIIAVKYPEEISDSAQILQFARNFMRYTSDRILYHTDEIAGQRVYKIETGFDVILKNAMKEERIKVSCRPVWSVKENRPVFAEAVVSIDDPEFGIIDEETLLEAANTKGVSLMVEEFVLDQAFSIVKSGILEKYGYSYLVVKISGKLGMQKGFTDRIWNLRSKYDILPGHICFAVQKTGRETIDDALDVNLKQLSRLGYKAAIYRFGSNYTVIKDLPELPLSFVCLDNRMVRGDMSHERKAVLRGTIAMLKSIPLEVVVSEVDTEEIRELLTDMGCELLQGKLFDGDEGIL